MPLCILRDATIESILHSPVQIQQYMVIYVVDVNDNAPSFVNLPYRAFIPEVPCKLQLLLKSVMASLFQHDLLCLSQDSPLDTFVFRVSATDPDYGLGGLVSYNITVNQITIHLSIHTIHHILLCKIHW